MAITNRNFRILNDNVSSQYTYSYLYSAYITGSGDNREMHPWEIKVSSLGHVYKSGTFLRTNIPINARTLSNNGSSISPEILQEIYNNTNLVSSDTTYIFSQSTLPFNLAKSSVILSSIGNDAGNTAAYYIFAYNSNGTRISQPIDNFIEDDQYNVKTENGLTYIRMTNENFAVPFKDTIIINYSPDNNTANYETLVDNNLDINSTGEILINVIMTRTEGKMFSNEAQFKRFVGNGQYTNIINLSQGDNLIKVKLDNPGFNSSDIYVAETGLEESNNTDKTFLITFLGVNPLDRNANLTNVTVDNVLTLQQYKEKIYSNTFTRPTVTSQAEYVLVDDVRDKSREYTNLSTIHTSVGDKYFGIRTRRNQTSGNIDSYNIKGSVVLLKPESKQNYIYTFSKGETYMLLDDKWTEAPFIINNNSYLFSYEYQNENRKVGECGVYFYGATSNKGWKKAEYTYPKTYINNDSLYIYEDFENYINSINSNASYVFSISYSCKGTTYTYNRLPVDTPFSIYTSDALFEPEFVEISNVNTALLYTYEYYRDYIDIYERQTSYNESLSAVHTIYNKLSTMNVGGMNIPTRYCKKYNYSSIDINDEPATKTTYYTYVSLSPNYGVYFPQQIGIVNDGSIKYYTYTYHKLSNEELSHYRTNTSVDIFIKQDYRKITADEFNAYKYTYHMYKCLSTVKTSTIPNNTLLTNLTLSENVVYGGNPSIALNYENVKTTLKTKNTNIQDSLQLNAHASNVNTNIQANNNASEYTAVSNGIKYEFDYSGLYERVLIYSGTTYEELNTDIYIKQPGYNKIPNSLISVGSNVNYYIWRIDEVPSSYITSLAEQDNPSLDKSSYIYIDCTYILPSYEGIYLSTYDELIGKKTKIARVNKYGFIKDPSVQYYKRNNVYIPSVDTYLHPNKEYYTYSPAISYGTLNNVPIAYLDLSGHTVQNYDNSYVYDLESIELYQQYVVSYTLDSIPYSSIQEVLNFTYDYIFFKSRYFYNTYSVNTGLNIDNDGNYYTDIFIYDGERGISTQKQYINQTTYTVTNYTYEIENMVPVIVENEGDVHDVPPQKYGDYWLEWHDASDNVNAIRLSESTYSPKYWFDKITSISNTNSTYNIITYVNNVLTCRYDGSQNKGAYQYVDTITLEPKVSIIDDMMVGLIFDNQYLDRNNELRGTAYEYRYKYEGKDNTVFEPVELFESIKIDDSKRGITLQRTKNINSDVTKNYSFSLTNDKEFIFKNSYTWHKPTHSPYLMFDGDKYEFKDLETHTGYWTKDYTYTDIPLKVVSYTYSIDSGINVSSTYSFVPNSYIVTAVIEHPQITYKYLTSEFEEYIYFTYLYDNVEYRYNVDDPVQINDDGTYIGLAFKDNSANSTYFPQKPVDLIKHITVQQNVKPSNIVLQEPYISYELFSYKTSLALTNEKIPSLYAIETVPATKKEILTWDVATSTYNIESVIESYSYISYRYQYETIPFIVAAYNYQASYNTIDNFSEIGTYISSAMSYINDAFNQHTFELSSMSYSLNNTIIGLSNNYGTVQSYTNSIFSEYKQSLGSWINAFNESSTYSTNALSVSMNNAIVSLESTLNNAISYNTETTNSNIANAVNEYSYQTETSRQALSNDIDSLKSYLHTDIIGNGVAFPASLSSYTDHLGYITYINTEISRRSYSLADVIATAMMNTYAVKASYTNNFGVTYTTIQYSYYGIADILSDLHVSQRIPTKPEFIVDVAKTLFTQTDFDNEQTTVKYDGEGNVISRSTKMNNPIDIAKKSIYRANILWQELGKAGVVPFDGNEIFVASSPIKTVNTADTVESKKAAAEAAKNKIMGSL